MEKKTLSGKLEFKLLETGTDAKTFTGYGAYFANSDAYDDVIQPGAFAATLAQHKADGTAPVMLWNHDSFAMPIGLWLDLAEDEKGLRATGQFLETSCGADAYTCVKAGAVTGLSIGYIVTASEMTKVDGKIVRLITEVKLIEISVVTFPANNLARISDVKSDSFDATTFLKTLLDMGISADDATSLLQKRTSTKENEGDDDEMPVQPNESPEDQIEDEEIASEAKYIQAARLSAVRTLIDEIKGNYGR